MSERIVLHAAEEAEYPQIVALTNWASLTLISLLGLAGYLYRIQIEEQALRESLGEPYIEYMQRTRRLIPFVY